MAVARINRIVLVGLENIKEEVLDYLQETGLVEIIRTELGGKSFNVDVSNLEKDLDSVSSTLKFLYSLEKGKALLFKERNILTFKEWQRIVNSYNYKKIIEEIQCLREALDRFSEEKIRLKEEYTLLVPYKNLDIGLEELNCLRDVSFYVGRIKKKNFIYLFKKTEELKTVLLKQISEEKNYIFSVIIFLKKDTPLVERILEDTTFERQDFIFKNLKISQRLSSIEERIIQIEQELQKINKKLRQYLEEIDNLETIFDHLYNLKNKILIHNNLASTESTFLLEGWVKKTDALRLKQALEKKFPVAVYLSLPKTEENVPVVLENRPMFQPFEVVTRLYGLPSYRGLDPTGFLSLFFVLSFALCLTDAGYGLILSIVSFCILKRFRLSITSKRFLQLFLISGISTVIIGAIFGGWFGNLFEKMPPSFTYFKKIKDSLLIFDPLKEPLRFLILVLVLGYLQITFGIFLKIIKLAKDKDYFDLFFNQIPTFLIQIVLFLITLSFMQIIPKQVTNFVFLIFVLAVVLIIIYHFRVQRDLGLKIFWSIYGVYGIITGNFLADTLSFSRLFALGLTTGLLATAINEIIFIISSILRSLKLNFLVVGFFAILLFVLAHLLNLAINLLGAYVHTSRLQYLEYFSKFFEIGGREFKPFRKEYVYTELINLKTTD